MGSIFDWWVGGGIILLPAWPRDASEISEGHPDKLQVIVDRRLPRATSRNDRLNQSINSDLQTKKRLENCARNCQSTFRFVYSTKFGDAGWWAKRYLTTLFGHLHREPPAGYARTTVSQLVSADKTVWQMLLEEGVQPKRDEAGLLALDVKLMESLQSYRVSFSLLPLVAKKDNGPSPSKTSKTANTNGGKGANRAERKVAKEKFEFPTTSSSWVERHRTLLAKQFVLGSIAALGAQMRLMGPNAGEGCTFVPSVMECTAYRSTSQVDSEFSRIAVGALPVIHQIDVWEPPTVFQQKIFQS